MKMTYVVLSCATPNIVILASFLSLFCVIVVCVFLRLFADKSNTVFRKCEALEMLICVCPHTYVYTHIHMGINNVLGDEREQKKFYKKWKCEKTVQYEIRRR